MIVFAAFTSVIALLESPAAYLVERKGLSRTKAAVVSGSAIWILSLLTIFSFAGAKWTKLDFGMGGDIFEFLDYITANIMLPLGGLLISIFTGWVMKTEIVKEELNLAPWQFSIVMILLRWVAPLGILVVFANSIGLLNLS